MRLITLLRVAVVGALLMFGMVASAPVVTALDEAEDAADETTDTVDEVTDPVTDPVTDEDDDDGFWDWGLLGLLGLLGLAGLFRQPKPVVHDTEPVGTRGTRANRVDDDTTL